VLRGVLHLHSNYSDGEFTLPELRRVLTHEGYTFACLTDHAEYFDQRAVDAYVEECSVLSDHRFCFVPGLEFRCDNSIHVLGLGVTRLLASAEPADAVRHIAECKGISIIAHPEEAAFARIASLTALPDGVEVWNSKRDGQYAPRPASFRILRVLQQRPERVLAFYGLDLHFTRQFRGLYNELECASLDARQILAALAAGRYVGRKDALHLPADGSVSDAGIGRFARLQHRSSVARHVLRGAKRLLDRAHIRVPAGLKSQLRRVL
jgi:hypothetical protein